MSMQSLERSIVAELRDITGKPRLRLKDMSEWGTSKEIIEKRCLPTEKLIHCPQNGVWVAVLKSALGE